MKKFILEVVITITLLFPFSSLAEFGKSCASTDEKIISSKIISELESNTIFGYVKKLIDIENCGPTYLGGCAEGRDSEFYLCVKNAEVPDIAANANNSTMTKLGVNSTVRLGEITPHPIIASDENLYNLNISLTYVGEQLCLVMPTTFGYAPLLCRNSSKSQPSAPQRDMSQCSEVSAGCSLYYNPNNPSRTYNGFFGNAIQCVYESLDIIFFDPRTCDRYDNDIMIDCGSK